MVINRAALHFFEEPPISGNRGSGTIFFGGCTMKCILLSELCNHRIPRGAVFTPEQLADISAGLRTKAHTTSIW
jgi:putative pyruvate formate lyase activating enzyme